MLESDHGEQVLFHGHPSPLAFLSVYVKGVLAAVLTGAAVGFVSALASGTVQTGWVVGAVLVIFLAAFLAATIERMRTTYTITSERLTIETGLLSRDLHETRLERLQSVNSRQTLIERVLGVGTVDFDIAAGAEYDFAFRGVAGPRRIVQAVDLALRERQRTAPGV